MKLSADEVKQNRLREEARLRMMEALNKLEYDEFGFPECWPSEQEVVQALGYPESRLADS